MKAMEGSKIPIVVGQQTEALSGGSETSGCLVLTPRLEFSKTSKVAYGVLNLDTDDLRIPLRFAIAASYPAMGVRQPARRLPSPTSARCGAAAAASGDTLSLAAAKAVNPRIESNRTLSKLLAAIPSGILTPRFSICRISPH